MIAGEVCAAKATLTQNADRVALALQVANSSDLPGQVGSNYPFAETNPVLQFDRATARGVRLDIAAGTAVRFKPGQVRDLRLVPFGGARAVWGAMGR